MTIDGNDFTGEYELFCDFCAYSEFYEADNFDDFIRQMQNDGWKSFKIDGEWTHKCADCVEKDKKKIHSFADTSGM